MQVAPEKPVVTLSLKVGLPLMLIVSLLCSGPLMVSPEVKKIRRQGTAGLPSGRPCHQ